MFLYFNGGEKHTFSFFMSSSSWKRLVRNEVISTRLLGTSQMSLFSPIKPKCVTSYSFRLSKTILKALLAKAVWLFGFIISAIADVVTDRKAGLKANAASMKAIQNVVGTAITKPWSERPRRCQAGLRKSPFIFVSLEERRIPKHPLKNRSRLMILMPFQKSIKSWQTRWLQRKNLMINTQWR